MMKPIASKLFLVIAVLGGFGATSRADEIYSNTRGQSSNGTLPAFVSLSGRNEYASAVSDHSASATAARHAAETLSAKFSDITTGSIPKADAASKQARSRVAVQDSTAARSIVLTPNQAEDPKTTTARAADATAVKVPQAARRLPRRAVRKASEPRELEASNAGLVAIGQKVGFLALLTNPALWH
jgi:hypothetical protein